MTLLNTPGTLLPTGFSDKVDPKIIQNLLGHSSDRITRDIYIHYVGSMGQDAVARFDDRFGKSA